MLSISIVEGDILERACDLLVLKYAGAFHGVDRVVAKRIGFAGNVEPGEYALVPGRRIKAGEVLFVGVGDLFEFRYAEIKKFGHQALRLASKLIEAPQNICMPIHGPGYGLDESEAFLSLIAGVMDAVAKDQLPSSLRTLEIVELDPKRVVRLRNLLRSTLEIRPQQVVKRGSVDITTRSEKGEGRKSASQALDHVKAKEELASYGEKSERKVKMFVAMPFKDKYTDEYDIAIMEAAQHANIVCERIDKEAYVGDVMNQVKARIGSYNGMLALLNDSNPNVFLEIGYAWAKDKPTVLMAKKGHKLPFDITGQKCIVYTNITDLRTRLKAELKALLDDGVLTSRGNN